jgi:hypothetical protein
MKETKPMARPIPTIPTPAILLEMSGYRSYTEWLARPMSFTEAAKLSRPAMKARRLAQTRLCRYRQKMAKAVARHDAASRHPTRDIIDVRSPVLMDA